MRSSEMSIDNPSRRVAELIARHRLESREEFLLSLTAEDMELLFTVAHAPPASPGAYYLPPGREPYDPRA